MAVKPVKVGIIGAGGIAQTHLTALADVKEIEVVAVADIVKEKAEQTAAKWGIPHVYQDYNEMLKKEDIEAVNICTYNQAHRAPAVDALHAGKHVIVEKPMAATLEDAAAMVRASHESGKLLMVALNPRFSEHSKAAKAIVDSGALGDIYYCETVAARRSGVGRGTFVKKETAGFGTVADIGVYCLDAALWLMGYPEPVAVSAIANNYLSTTLPPTMGGWTYYPETIEVEDFGVGWVRFENGMAMVFKTCWIMHMDNIGGTFFLGTKGGMKLNPLTVYRHEWGLMVDITPQNIPATERIECFRRQNRAFAEAIREGKPSPIPGDELLITNVIIQGVIDSAAAGYEIEVSVPKV